METKKLVPFFSAAVTLAELCDKIDSAEEIEQSLIEQFNDAKLTLAESIDRRKHVYKECQARIALAKSYKKDIDETIKRLQKIQDRIEENTKQMIAGEPNLPYQDTLGNKLSVRKNSQPALKYSFDIRESKNFSNILDEQSIALLEIDRKYLREVSFYTIDTEALKKDLLEGHTISWANLEWGTHVRGLTT
jgi:chromosome segregation ATPase